MTVFLCYHVAYCIISEMDETYFTLRFVLPQGKTEATCSELLSEAYEKCRDHDIKPAWINHDDVLDLSPVKQVRLSCDTFAVRYVSAYDVSCFQDVFVMDPFDGQAFSFLTRFKCTVVGPRCLLSCLAESVPVPELPYPMYTAALRGCVVTSTGFSREKKSELQLRIERMGGIYANAFHDGVTHLIAEVGRIILMKPRYI